MKEPNSKILRWKCTFADYDFDKQYLQEKTNHSALSRNAIQEINIVENESSIDPSEVLDKFLSSENTPLYNILRNNGN